jgi:nucleoside 2-deoxyribosyltransferase
MKFYLAGKIGRDDWRHSLVLGLRDAIETSAYTPMGHGAGYGILPDEWPILKGALLGQHDYVGPFFMPSSVSDRDGVDSDVSLHVHGSSKHGNAIGSPNNSECDAAHKHIVRLCLNAILKSDAVFVWMDSRTAYGTLVEIGFALAHRKPIWWGEASRPYDALGRDFWFARETAEMVEFAPDARTALDRMLALKFRPQINGYVYILRSGDFIKIGKSKNVDQRLTQISPKTPMPVTLLHTITSDDMSWAEAQLHRHYAHYRTNGEWFLLPQADLDWLLTINHLSRTLAPARLR